MKIAIVCPIGDLNRFGYWRTAQVCLESWRDVGDLFLIHSSRIAIPFSIGVANYIRNGLTLMDMTKAGEHFDHTIVANNANIGLTLAREVDYDVAITICVNWYVEQSTARTITEVCRDMLDAKLTHDFLYRRIQIGPRLFDADLKSIAVVNLQQVHGDVVKILVDRAEIEGKSITSIRGDFVDMNGEAYIDCEYELTVDELRDKLIDVRNYDDILPKRRGVDWSFWEHYYQDRVTRMTVSSDEELGQIGQQVAALHPANAFGDWLLDQVKVSI